MVRAWMWSFNNYIIIGESLCVGHDNSPFSRWYDHPQIPFSSTFDHGTCGHISDFGLFPPKSNCNFEVFHSIPISE